MAAGWGWPDGSRTIDPACYVSDEFGPRIHPIYGYQGYHYGIDLYGFDLNVAAADGVVIYAQYNGGAGNEVRVQHPGGTVTKYKHNASFLVSVGQSVQRGQALGVQGSTGDSTGKHCHFETLMSLASDPMNPREFMRARITEGAGPAGGGGVPFPIEMEEDPMFIVNNDGTQFEFVPGILVRHITGFNPDLPTIQAAHPGITTIGFPPGVDKAKSEELFVWSIIHCGLAEYTRDEVFNLSKANGGRGGGILFVGGKSGGAAGVVAAVKAAIADALEDVAVEVPPLSPATIQAIAEKTQAQLAPAFASLPDAVVDELGTAAARLKD